MGKLISFQNVSGEDVDVTCFDFVTEQDLIGKYLIKDKDFLYVSKTKYVDDSICFLDIKYSRDEFVDFAKITKENIKCPNISKFLTNSDILLDFILEKDYAEFLMKDKKKLFFVIAQAQ